MALKNKLLAMTITTLFCINHNALAEAYESTIILNGIERTMEFANINDANNMMSMPTANDIGLFFNGSESPFLTGLIIQTELNNVPMLAVKVSGTQAVLLLPQADGTSDFFTLSTISPDGTPLTTDGKPAYYDEDGFYSNNVYSLSQLLNLSLYAAADVAHADPILLKALYHGVSEHTAMFVDAIFKDALNAEVKTPVNVASGGWIADNNDPAALVRALLLQQILLKQSANLPKKIIGLTPLTVLPDMQAITLSSVVQKITAQTALEAAITVATNVSYDPALIAVANNALIAAKTAEQIAYLNYLNDPTVLKTPQEIAEAIKNTYEDNLALLNNNTASIADREKAKLTLDNLLAQFSSNLTNTQKTTIQLAERIFTNDVTIIRQLTILQDNKASPSQKADALQVLNQLLNTNGLTATQKADIISTENSYGVNKTMRDALITLSNISASTNASAKAVSFLEKTYKQAQQEARSTDTGQQVKAQINLKLIALVGEQIANVELDKAKIALSSVQKSFNHTTTAGQIIAQRQTLTVAQAAAQTSEMFHTIAVHRQTSAGSSSALSATDIVAQTRQQLATTSTAGYFAHNSSANGIAGNPASLLNMSADYLFNQADDSNQPATVATATSNSGYQHSIGVGMQYNYYNLAGTMVNTASLPLSYTAQLSNKSQVLFSVPLSYINQNQNDSYQIGTGLAFKYKPTDNWTLSPAFSYAYRTVGYTHYTDYYAKRALGDDVAVLGGALSSQYTWTCHDFKWSLTNMASYFSIADGFGATPINAMGYSNDLGNFVLKNGISIAKNINGFGVSAYLNDAHYFGSKVFFDQYNELGFTLKPQTSGALNAFSINANYLFNFKDAKRGDLDGFKINLNYQF